PIAVTSSITPLLKNPQYTFFSYLLQLVSLSSRASACARPFSIIGHRHRQRHGISLRPAELFDEGGDVVRAAGEGGTDGGKYARIWFGNGKADVGSFFFECRFGFFGDVRAKDVG